MIKPIIISFNAIFVFLFAFFFGDTPVSITGSFPKNVKPATEFVAEILVKKGTISGFAKYQIEVPEGFTVKELESKGGNFSFANNVGKIIWTSVPSEEEFTLKVILNTEANISGLKTIGSKFSYINNNIKEVIEMNPVEIMVGDAASKIDSLSIANTPTTIITPTITPPTSVVETNSITETPITTAPPLQNDSHNEPPSNVICSREILKGSSENQFIVNVKIVKGSVKGFAKFQETLPVGYTAKADKTSGSSFSVSDGKAKFVWVSLPETEELLISYFLDKTKNAKEDAKLSGEFSYLENNQTKKTTLSNDFVKANSSVVSINTKTVIENPESNDVSKNELAAEKKEVEKVEEKQASSALNSKSGNIKYNVQIGAFKNDISSDVLARKFKVKETIKSEMAESYHKFMVGNFEEYKQAKSNREVMKQKGCKSAFVVAYNDAKRITVQEALMITSQKWFK